MYICLLTKLFSKVLVFFVWIPALMQVVLPHLSLHSYICIEIHISILYNHWNLLYALCIYVFMIHTYITSSHVSQSVVRAQRRKSIFGLLFDLFINFFFSNIHIYPSCSRPLYITVNRLLSKCHTQNSFRFSHVLFFLY